jgi:hypothetical protein
MKSSYRAERLRACGPYIVLGDGEEVGGEGGVEGGLVEKVEKILGIFFFFLRTKM